MRNLIRQQILQQHSMKIPDKNMFQNSTQAYLTTASVSFDDLKHSPQKSSQNQDEAIISQNNKKQQNTLREQILQSQMLQELSMKEDQSNLNKATHFKKKSSTIKIKKMFKKFNKTNSKIGKYMREITKQLKQKVKQQNEPDNLTLTCMCNPPNEQQVLKESIDEFLNTSKKNLINDSEVMKESCFRKLLMERRVDNDVESDEEDLNVSIRFMYGELLYSIGNQIKEARNQPKYQKKQPIKKAKFQAIHQDNDKENQDQNNLIRSNPKNYQPHSAIQKSSHKNLNHSISNKKILSSNVNVAHIKPKILFPSGSSLKANSNFHRN